MTINEIAALSGVSRATVSRYLNNGYVSEEKKVRIQKIIEETGYQPSAQAQMLRAKKTSCIAVLVPNVTSKNICEMLQGISEILTQKGYQCILFNTLNNPKDEYHYLKQLTSNRVDGIIFIGSPFSKDHYRIMKNNNIPFVVLGQQVKDYSCVYADEYGAAKTLTNEALQTGSHHAFIGNKLEDEVSERERLYGFLDAHFEINHTITDDCCIKTELTIAGGYHAAKDLLQKHDNLTAIVCTHDELAAGVVAYLDENDIKLSQKPIILSFGNESICNIIKHTMGSHFDPQMEEVFVKSREELETYYST